MSMTYNHLGMWNHIVNSKNSSKNSYCIHLDISFVKPVRWASLWALPYTHIHSGAEIEHGIPISFAIKPQVF